jgi:hypothetical protein
MSTYVCAFIEYQLDGSWQLFESRALEDRKPPYNFAPEPWGEYNFSVYYQQSGEKGLPDELSAGLKKIIETQLNKFNDDVLNRPSWMSLDELVTFLQSDVDYQYAHLNLGYLEQLHTSLNASIRVVFWAE